MKPLRAIELDFWRAYLKSDPRGLPQTPLVEASYAGGKSSTDALLALYLAGEKTAGSSIVEDFVAAGDPLPKVGNYWILLKSDDEPGCILRTEKTVLNKFMDVPPEIAVAEGEGDLSLDHWRMVHEQAFASFLGKWGLARIEDATVVTEYFTIVHR